MLRAKKTTSKLIRLVVNNFTRKSTVNMGEVMTLVDSKIAGKKVMVFSKEGCPYCTKAKNTFSKYLGNLLKESDYEVLEIDGLSNCSAIQDYLQKLTGARSVNIKR
ncbi:hypothetical protein Btru_016447 [Bulinus truncatus]|nr:hypothetical protein Btru_016447 [Bulinus truncatus]